MLEETAALLNGDVQTAVLAVAVGTPFSKPADHKGGKATDMFPVDLPADVLRSIVAVVDEAARRGRRTPRSSKIGGFATAWRELAAARTECVGGMPARMVRDV